MAGNMNKIKFDNIEEAKRALNDNLTHYKIEQKYILYTPIPFEKNYSLRNPPTHTNLLNNSYEFHGDSMQECIEHAFECYGWNACNHVSFM